MFPLHENTRRAIARMIFVLCCALPTSLVMAWAICWNGATHRQLLLEQLSKQTGYLASAESVSHPWSDTVRYQQVELRDHETRQLIASLEQLDIIEQADHRQIIIPTAQFTLVGWQQLQQRLATAVQGTSSQPWRMQITELQLGNHGESPLATMYQVLARELNQTEQRAIVVSLRWQPNEPIPTELRWERKLAPTDALHPEREWVNAGEIRTGSSPLPGGLLAMKEQPPWLSRTLFQGTIRWLENRRGLQAEAQGELFQVDLQAALGDPLAQRWSGKARLSFAPLYVRDSQLMHWKGTIYAEQGEIGRELFIALQSLGCKPLQPNMNLTAVTLPYDQLSMQIEWQPTEVFLRGTCPSQPAGTLLSAHGRPLLGEKAGSLGAPSALLNALAPVQTPRLPALPSLAGWLKWIPTSPSLSREPVRLVDEQTAQHDRR